MKQETLIYVLNKMLDVNITGADYETKQLQGGTLGDIRLVTGIAETADGGKLPYKVVCKSQKKFERHGDPGSWRREYDLYASDFEKLFTESFRLPVCYHAELNGDEHQIWMEYIDGISGLELSGEMYERAAEELGRFQGRIYAGQPLTLQNITNLSNVEYMKNNYLHYRSWKEIYDYIRSNDCEIPKHICKMLIGIDENEDEVWNHIEKLPVVLCHRDFWVANIFCSNDKLISIDWDTAGWGYLGEDIASLIADEADVEHMVEYYHKCSASYYKGFSEYADISHISDNCIYELILLMFGYRLIEWYKFDREPGKTLWLDVLQKIYEMKAVNDAT